MSEQVWYYGERCFVQEPIFAPRPGGTAEDDGWVLQVVNDAGAETSKLHIFEAQDIAKGPVAGGSSRANTYRRDSTVCGLKTRCTSRR